MDHQRIYLLPLPHPPAPPAAAAEITMMVALCTALQQPPSVAAYIKKIRPALSSRDAVCCSLPLSSSLSSLMHSRRSPPQKWT